MIIMLACSSVLLLHRLCIALMLQKLYFLWSSLLTVEHIDMMSDTGVIMVVPLMVIVLSVEILILAICNLS